MYQGYADFENATLQTLIISSWKAHLETVIFRMLHHASSSFAIYGQNRPEQG